LGADAYAWWYIDALSDDGRHALTLIAFIGSVFSPYYARARRHGPADPTDHVAVNLALYGDGPRCWTMTERGAGALERDASRLRIGPSALAWADDGALEVAIDEVAVPWPRRVRGRLRLEPLAGAGDCLALDPAVHHRWQTIAPRARVHLMLDEPALAWSGHGYLDSNWGDEPLEQAFHAWHWSRTALADGRCRVGYDLHRRDGSRQRMDLMIDPDGRTLDRGGDAPRCILPRSRWGLEREAQGSARLRSTLEDGPFYARALLATAAAGGETLSIHETLCLDRFRQPWVQAMLPFRMPRRAR